VCLSCVAQVYASDSQANTPDGLLDIPLEDLMNVKFKTVYGASKHQQKISEAPSSVTIVTGEEIKRFGYRTLADILEGTRSFFTTYDRNYKYVGVRGFGRPADYNNRVLILLDGYRLNENIAGASPVGYDLPLDVDLIDRIEIIRGSGSSLYGTNALYAVINIITKKARDYGMLEVQGEVASFETLRGRATYGKTVPDGPDVLVSATGYDSDGPTLYYSEFDDPSANSGKVDNDSTRYDNLFVKASMDKLTLTAAHVNLEKAVPTAPWGTVFGDSRTRTVDAQTLIGLDYQDDITEDFGVSARVSYNLYDYRGWWTYDWAEDPDPPDLVVNEDLWEGRWWIGELTFTNRLSSRHRLTWGTEFQYNQRQKQKNWDRDVYLFDSRSTRNWALFAQDEFTISENLLLSAGVRFDEYVHDGAQHEPASGAHLQAF
jgi:outer membrane receptor for ferrienterochelin and colicins